jgi:hypothetical protein
MIQVIGQISPPPGVEQWRKFICFGPHCLGVGEVPGLIPFLNAIIKLLIVIAGLYAFLNIILAGYGFLTASDDPKKMTAAWAKIWQSALGLVVIAGSFVLAAILGYLIFGDPAAILRPTIYGP